MRTSTRGARVGVLATALVVALFVSADLRAQARVTGADLAGTVRDASGGVLEAATVSVTSLDTNLTRSTVTDARGHFVVPALAPGAYRVNAEHAGFATATREPLALRVGQSVEVNVSLTVAGSAAVTVRPDAPLVDVRDASVSQVVGASQIESLPISGRNVIAFAVIAPGVTLDNTPGQGAIATSGLSFAGQRARSNNITVDGLDNNDVGYGAVRALFSQEAIREFQVLTSSYSAEFGKASGGVLNIVTRSGTNETHGGLFGYFRDTRLNARDRFERFDVFGGAIDRAKSPFRQAQYGATLGGPVRRDKTFFFVAVERLDQTASNFVTIGDAAAAVFNRLGFPVTTGPNPYAVRQTRVFGKIDHHWSAASTLVVRANASDRRNENVEPFGGLVARSRGAVLLAADDSLSASQSQVPASRWVNEARVQYAHLNQAVHALDPRCSGPCLGVDQGGPTLEVLGVGNVGRQRFTPQIRVPDRVQLVDTVSYFAGRHQLKSGVDYNRIHSELGLPLQFGGRFVFPGLAALVAGTPAVYVQGYGVASGPQAYQDVSLFLQDEWRRNRVTITPGVRYQVQFFADRVFDVSDLNGGRFRYAMPQPRGNVAPRLALAWDPLGRGRTALRASYGLFYDNQVTGPVATANVTDGSAAGIRTLAVFGPLAQAAWNAPAHQLTEAGARSLLGGSFPSLTISMDPRLRTPYAHQASVGFEQAIGPGMTVSADAIVVRGTHQLGLIDYNPSNPALGSPIRRPNDVGDVAGTSAPVLQFTSFGDTWYRGATVSVQTRAAAGNQVLVAYTLSSSEDNATDFQGDLLPQSMGFGRNPADPGGLPRGFDPNSERGPSVWDERHRLVVSGQYRLPAGVRISGIATAASGRPFTPLAGADLNGDGSAVTDRARVNPADIATSVGRNSARLPGQATVDLRVGRTFRVGTRGAVTVEPLVEAFNLFNRTNDSAVNNVFGAGAFPNSPAKDAQGRVTYGTFTQALPPRQIQLGAKVSF